MKIGVFDSGIGGLSVAQAIQVAMPNADVLFMHDEENFPYGGRAPDEIFEFVVPIFEALIDEGCVVIVVACNTVSTTLIERLRDHFSLPLVAIEPMVKPAVAMTKSNVIAVCATPTTLASERYDWLKTTYAKGVKVIEPDCSDWSSMIEQGAVDEQKIAARIKEALDAGADVIVLGCTHYHWIENEIQAICVGRATVIQPEPAIIAQVQRVLDELN